MLGNWDILLFDSPKTEAPKCISLENRAAATPKVNIAQVSLKIVQAKLCLVTKDVREKEYSLAGLMLSL